LSVKRLEPRAAFNRVNSEPMSRLQTLLSRFVLTCAAPRALFAQERFGVHLFGVSYHYQSRTHEDANGILRRYEQFNPGLGGEYVLRQNEHAVITAEAGAYRDSKDGTNVFAGPALRLRFGAHLLVGGAVVVMTTKTIRYPVAPLPLMTVRWRHVGLNATWIPALDRQNSGAVAMFSTFYL
jgi:hypothetical protein